MYAVASYDSASRSAPPLAPVAQEVADVLEMRDRAIASGELLYCSPVIRALIEREIPRLIALATHQR